MTRTTFYGQKNVPVTIEPNIGLDAHARESIILILNLLLADEMVLMVKTQRASEAVSKTGVQEPGPLYQIQYDQMEVITHEIVERIQILGGVNLHGSEELIDTARLRVELETIPDDMKILADHEVFIRFLREDVRKCVKMVGDQGSFWLLVQVLRSHEKMAWILRSKIFEEQNKEQHVP